MVAAYILGGCIGQNDSFKHTGYKGYTTLVKIHLDDTLHERKAANLVASSRFYKFSLSKVDKSEKSQTKIIDTKILNNTVKTLWSYEA